MHFSSEISKKKIGYIGEHLVLNMLSKKYNVLYFKQNFNSFNCELDFIIYTRTSILVFEVKSGFNSFQKLKQNITTKKIEKLTNCLSPRIYKDIRFYGVFVKFNKKFTKAKIQIIPLSIY